MILSDMVAFVCGKVNQTAAEDLAACRGFIQRRYEMIWNADLWKDSICQVTKALSAADPLTTTGHVLVPRAVERVLAVRTPDRQVPVIAPEVLWRVDVDEFARTGTPFQFAPMAPVVWVRPPGLADQVQLLNSVQADSAVSVSLSYMDAAGEAYDVTLAPGDAGAAALSGPPQEVLSFSKKATTGNVSLVSAADNATVFARLGPTDTDFLTFRRLRLLDIPDQDTTLRILGKGRPAGFKGDNDSPRITGVTNCLLSFAQADMLERERQYGKAQSKLQEAVALLADLRLQETVQEAQNRRIMPDGGYGEDVLTRAVPFSF
ncbi:MAG TPA: hypothetical protein VHA37_04560 [Candidatus Saccharimonadales bacterium]|nr:hypothetical protein [Candidatus Saccharimonadales bacterium]